MFPRYAITHATPEVIPQLLCGLLSLKRRALRCTKTLAQDLETQDVTNFLCIYPSWRLFTHVFWEDLLETTNDETLGMVKCWVIRTWRLDWRDSCFVCVPWHQSSDFLFILFFKFLIGSLHISSHFSDLAHMRGGVAVCNLFNRCWSYANFLFFSLLHFE
jgi:hypothetical protein